MKTMDILIETPKGSAEKYAYEEASGHFRLKKIMPVGMMFPFDFGLIPDTKGEDGDPLDALVISEFASFPGCVVECRVIGAMLAEQKEKGKVVRNDRFFFVPVLSKQFSAVESLKDLPEEHRKQTQNFFVQYNKAEGKEFEIIKVIDAAKAYKLINKTQ
jgi:inorganic pyrophosphatase